MLPGNFGEELGEVLVSEGKGEDGAVVVGFTFEGEEVWRWSIGRVIHLWFEIIGMRSGQEDWRERRLLCVRHRCRIFRSEFPHLCSRTKCG